MFVMNQSRKRISPIWFTVGFFLFAIALGLILRNFYNTDALLILMAGPILVAAVFYPRWVYITITAIAAITALLVTRTISASYSSSIRSTVMIVLTLVVASEIIRRIIEVNSRAQKALAESEERYRSFVQNFQGIAYRVRLQSHVIFFHGAVEQITGYTEQDFIAGKPTWVELIDPQDFPLIEDSFQLVRTQPNYAGQREYRIKRKDGKTVWIRENFQNVSGSDGKPEFIQGAIYDITDSKQIEDSLQRSQARSSAILNAIPDLMFQTLQDGTIIDYHANNPSKLAAPPEVFLGKKLIDVLPPDVDAVLQDCIRETVKTGQLQTVEYSIILNNEPNHFEARMILCGEEILCIVRDITGRKSAQKLQTAIYEISQLALVAPSLEDVYRSIHDTVQTLIPADNFYIAELDKNTNLLIFPYWADAHDPCPEPAPPERGLTEYVLETGESLLVPPHRFDELVAEGKVESIGAPSIDWLGVPLKIDGETIGVIVVQSYTEAIRFGNREKRILEFVSAQIAMSIHRRRADAALRESEERYALAVRGANDGLWDWDMRTNRVYYSPRWKEILGLEEQSISNSPDEWFSRIHREDVRQVMADLTAHLKGLSQHFESEYRSLHQDGEYRWILVRGLAVRDANGAAVRMSGSITDVTIRRTVEDRLRHDALHDPLTGLPNRPYFIEQLRRCIEWNRKSSGYVAAVLFLDLDRFKVVNESLGHYYGDQMLIAVSQRLQENLRPGDTLTRFGGDEFGILMENLKSVNEAIQFARHLQQALSQPYTIDNREVFSSASIGITIIDNSVETPEGVLRDADTALYRAKSKGRARYEIFDSEMHAASMNLLQIEMDLRRAMERHELRVYYQPIIALKDGRISGFEALIRWQHPTHGLLPPGSFISIAEETGLIIPIGEWVLREACARLKDWHRAGYPELKMAVNISAQQIELQDFPITVQSILSSIQLDPHYLQLEVTESAAMKDMDLTLNILTAISHTGVEIAVDDFGTSYSSLSYLKRFPIQNLKIAQSFIANVPQNLHDAAITQAIVALAHALDLSITAEGVETREQLDFLTPLGCDQIQGYLISRPQPDGAILPILQENKQQSFQVFQSDSANTNRN